MKLRNRLLLVALGIILFLTITPILVLYARGFEFDWRTGQITKTGALVVRTEPEKARIFLNNELLNQTTPANVRFLLPGDYNLRIEKDGYQSWTKRLSVRSQLVTWANANREFITMFLINPITKKTWNGTGAKLFENRIIFLNNTVPTSIDIQNGDEDTIRNIPNDLPDMDPVEIKNLLTAFNISQPEFSQGEIIRTANQIYLILDQTLYLVNDELEKIYSPVKAARYYENSKRILYANDNEAYLYYTEWKTMDLILRSLTPVQNPILNDETGYLFFQNEGKIKAIELDSRDHRNIYNLVDGLENFVVSTDGKKLFTFNDIQIREYTIR